MKWDFYQLMPIKRKLFMKQLLTVLLDVGCSATGGRAVIWFLAASTALMTAHGINLNKFEIRMIFPSNYLACILTSKQMIRITHAVAMEKSVAIRRKNIATFILNAVFHVYQLRNNRVSNHTAFNIYFQRCEYLIMAAIDRN